MLRDHDHDRLIELQRMLATGQGISKTKGRGVSFQSIQPRRSDERVWCWVDGEGTQISPRTTGSHIDCFPDRVPDKPSQRFEVLDRYSLHAPRYSVGLNSLDDVFNGNFKPVHFVHLEFSPHHYAKVSAEAASLRGYVSGYRFPSQSDRFRKFDPTPYFEDTYGFIRFIGR